MVAYLTQIKVGTVKGHILVFAYVTFACLESLFRGRRRQQEEEKVPKKTRILSKVAAGLFGLALSTGFAAASPSADSGVEAPSDRLSIQSFSEFWGASAKLAAFEDKVLLAQWGPPPPPPPGWRRPPGYWGPPPRYWGPPRRHRPRCWWERYRFVDPYSGYPVWRRRWVCR